MTNNGWYAIKPNQTKKKPQKIIFKERSDSYNVYFLNFF